MIAPDPFSQYYRPLLENTYDVVDRIVLNAYFGLASSPGGFRLWWHRLHGTEDNLDDTHLMRMAGRFARRVRGWAKKCNIPVVFCPAGQRKHLAVEPYMPSDPNFGGIFAVQISRAPAPVWEVLRSANGGFHLRRKRSMPYVNHYSFQVIDHHVDDLRCRRSLDRLGEAVSKLAEILGRFLNVLRCVDVSWISDRLLEDLPMPTVIGRTRVGGVDINKPRQRAVMEAAIALSITPGGFTAAQHADKVREILGLAAQGYAPRHAAYDLKKLRAKGLIRKTAEHSRRYEAIPDGLRAMACLIVLRDKVIKPLLHCGGHRKTGRQPAATTEVDSCYDQVQCSMQQLFKTLHIAA
jgi:hypothetical protein